MTPVARHIVVVDNEPHMQRLIEFTLKRTGAAVTTVGSGPAALAAVRARPADLLIVDYMMPGMDGFQTIRALRADPALARIPVIVMTSRGEAGVRDEAVDLGIAAFFTKPFGPTDLLDEVKRLLHL